MLIALKTNVLSYKSYNSNIMKSKSRNKSTERKVELWLFLGLYTLLLTVNAVFVSSGSEWATLNGIAVASVAFSLWYYTN